MSRPATNALISHEAKLRIRARSGIAERTLNAYLKDPSAVRPVSRMRIERAAGEEGVDLPKQPNSAPPPQAA